MIQTEVIRQSAVLLKRLGDAGYDIEVEDDFEAVSDWNKMAGRVRRQAPHIALERNDFTRGSAFWVFLLKDGQRIGTLGCRHLDLKGETFGRFVTRTYNEALGGGQRVVKSVAPSLNQLIGSGRMIMFGDLFLLNDQRGDRRMLAAYSRLVMILAGMTWPEFDWMIAFMIRSHGRVSELYGFTYKLPRVVTWQKPYPEGRDDAHMMAAIPACDYRHLLTTGEMSQF